VATVAQEYEKLKFELSKGHGGEKIHVTWIERDQAERIKNNKRVTKFVLETKDPDACSELHAEWERIIKRVGNKSVALSLVHMAWRDALSNGELDKILARMEGPE
jgi:hypothetical protein